MHLQNDKVAVAAANPIVSGWMNPFISRTSKLARKNLESYGFIETPDNDEFIRPLQINYYKFDKICPQFLTCIPMDRGIFAQCNLIKNYNFIMQDRTFTLGPAIFFRLLDYFELRGKVIQTHVTSPKSTAYLASLFLTSNRIEKFVAFGAEEKYNN